MGAAMADQALVFVDAGVLLACFDPEAGERRERAQAWLRRLWAQRLGRTSQQVLGEADARGVSPVSWVIAPHHPSKLA